VAPILDGMRYRLLGRSGLRVSELALGAMTFSDRGLSWGASPDESRAIFEAFANAGGTFVDTANIYGDLIDAEDHASERVLADLIASDRQHFVVASKYTSSNTRDVSRSGNSLKSMRQTVDGSLRALRTDYLDVLWLHTWDGTTPVDEVMRGASQLVQAGKILYFGFSDTPAWVGSQAAALAGAHGWTPPVAIEVQYNLIERSVEQELLPMAQSLDLGVVAWSPLAAGLLSGNYGRGAENGSRFADANWQAVADTAADPREAIASALDGVAAELGRPPAQVALAWLRQRPGVVVPILGARTRAQIESNLAGLDLVLSPDQLRRLEGPSAPSLGFPQAFLASDTVRRYSTSGYYDRIENHRAPAYAE
jgi:aryl-alcohol dehydrogenase-like predicted oxidoreductase